MSKIISLDEFIEKLNKPIKSTSNGLEDPNVKIDRMFKEAIEKSPEHKTEIEKEWKVLKEKQKNGEITNLEFQIKEILSRFNAAVLSESEDEEDTQKIPGNPFNNKANDIKKWLIRNLNNYEMNDRQDKLINDILDYFKMNDVKNDDKDLFLQIVNKNLE